MIKLSKIIGLTLLAGMILSACGPAATATQAPAQPTVAPAATEAPAATMAPAATQAPASSIDCAGAQSGDTLSMLYQWSGEEEGKLNAILKPFVDACGITLKPESTRDQGLLDTRVKAGTPPDIAFWRE